MKNIRRDLLFGTVAVAAQTEALARYLWYDCG